MRSHVWFGLGWLVATLFYFSLYEAFLAGQRDVAAAGLAALARAAVDKTAPASSGYPTR